MTHISFFRFALRGRAGGEEARRHSHLLMGPWVHGLRKPAGDVDFSAAHSMLDGLGSSWYDRWLKGKKNDEEQWPVMRFFVMGLDKWVDTDVWPPKRSTPKKYYLTRETIADQPPAEDEAPSVFSYDPTDPVPTLGGANLILKNGIRDHRANAERPDVLAFISGPMDQDTTIAGCLSAHLFVSSNAPDTDFTAMLLDVLPGGYMANIQDGITRARYRNGRANPQPLKPGEIVKLDIDLWSTAYQFKKGHRAGILISSSNFPRFDRNLNTADVPGKGTQMQKAENRVYHDAAHASNIDLPVVE